jgi:hypothetical protein
MGSLARLTHAAPDYIPPREWLVTSEEFKEFERRFKELMNILEHAKDTKTRRQTLILMRNIIRDADRFLEGQSPLPRNHKTEKD